MSGEGPASPQAAAAIEEQLSIGADFPPVGYDAWKAKAVADLRGASFERRLVGHTEDGIVLEPISTAQDWPSAGDPSGFPGSPPFTRGMAPLARAPGGWDVRQEVVEPEPAVANAVALDEAAHGVTSIELRLDAAACAGLDGDDPAAAGLCGRGGLMAYSAGDLGRALDGLELDAVPVSLSAGAACLPAAALLAVVWEERGVGGQRGHGAAGADEPRAGAPPVRGAFNADPLGALLRDGGLPVSLEAALGQMADLAAWTAANLPGATSVRVSTAVYHDAGSSSVQDLAFALATAVEYLRAMTAAGLELEAAVRQLVFHETVGCRFYQAIAKLRALRTLWGRAMEVCGVDAQAAAAPLLVVETSRRVITHREPWVNLLRNTAACYAGVLGGADAVVTLPMDVAIGASDGLTRRLARDTQLILQEECHLGEVLDPVGGSWSLETLTDEMAEKAWGRFREIESRGGMAAAATSGWVASQIATVERRRAQDIATRKAAITGVSAHPDVFEEALDRPAPDYAALRAAAAGRLADWRRERGEDLAAALRDVAGRNGVGRAGDLTAAAVGVGRGGDLTAAPGSGGNAGDLTAAAVRAARAGATIGELTTALAGPEGCAARARVTPLPVRPYAAAYEQLRDQVDAYTEAHGGERPQAFLARLGSPKEYLARATYAQDFLEAGGFALVIAEGPPDAQAAACAISGAAIAVICSSDARYATDVADVAPLLHAAGARVVVLAGSPGAGEAGYRAAGVDRFIFVRCDVLAILRDLLHEAGVS